MRAAPYHLTPGSDIRLCLEQLAQELACQGFVLSVVGNLSQAAFRCPGQAEPTVLRGELEIITLQGTLSPDGVHLHLSFSDPNCQVWGGHLETGTLVGQGADLLVGLLENAAPEVPLVSGEPRIALAVSGQCPYSRRTLRLLRTLGIPYDLVEPIEGMGVPQVSIDGELIGGYDALVELHGRGELEPLRQA